MASSQKPTKPASSRWNFLSQAVNAVESRLDTILADEEDVSKSAQPAPVEAKENATAAASRDSVEVPRSSTPSAGNDRLQQRLAQAMAKRNSGKADGTPVPSEPVSRSSTPAVVTPKISQEQATEIKTPILISEEHVETTSKSSIDSNTVISGRPSRDLTSVLEIPTAVESGLQRMSADSLRRSQDISARSTLDDSDAALLEAQLEHEDERSRMQEEIQGYIERIDALSSKLQYLAKEAAQSAKDISASTESGSMEKKLAERDEKIALLMQEGQKLSVTEMKNLTIIKRLRSQMATSTKDHDAVRKRAEIAERRIASLDEKARRAEQLIKKLEAQTTTLSKSSQDLEAVTRERNALNSTLAEMKAQVAKANTRAEAAEKKASTEKLEAEQKRNAGLQDDLTSAKVERELIEEKFKREIKDLQANLEREKEHTRAMETEMLGEQAMLEGKLEAFRVRAEEASSSDQGDSLAKLLRQIETLQSQYAAASQNWQGIEGTLLARIAALEKDRDEVTAREADVRKKLRDATLKAKSSDREYEEAHIQLAALQDGQTDIQAEVQSLERRNNQLEDELSASQKELEEQKTRLEREYVRRLDEEKAKWAASISRVRTESPSYSTRKGGVYDMERLTSPISMDRPVSRRSSAMPSAVSGYDGLQRQYSASNLRGIPNGTILETPSIVASADQDDYFSKTPATPGGSDHNHHSRRGYNDLISTSTVGAGPSVQLVERMSANVRRLESEKAASKDELARITNQRDESRSEVVRLMRELEQKKKIEERLKGLESEHQSLNQRHQTTLELLGEKSEQVDELKQDIVDVKQMYRELADHMK